MVLIWGANYSVIKRAFEEIPAQAFNAMRLVLASAVFLTAIFWIRRRAARRPATRISSAFYSAAPLTARDWRDLVWLGLVGHFLYQFCFIAGVDETSVSNAALIIGSTPVVVALFSAVLGREHISRLHWLGAAISLSGLYLVVGRGAAIDGATLRGDLMIVISVSCWAVYTLGASRLLRRHSPLFVTGTTMTLGGVPYAIVMAPRVMRIRWAHVSAASWWSLIGSALLALCLAYLIWYVAVQKIGASRTSIYSNLVPITAMLVAAVWLREPVSLAKLIGAAAVLGGVFLTRLGRPAPPVPIEE
jgi:drug/metabolite transporter (DMT)-like permease